MSSGVEVAAREANDTAMTNNTRSRRVRQTLAIMRLEVRKNFFGRRAILIYLLALVPVGIVALLALTLALHPPDADEWRNAAESSTLFARIYEGLYEGLILRTIVFFGCAWIFMNLFRGEIVDRSLHYYFLAPVRREVLVIGKYLSGLFTAIVLFTATTLLTMFFLYLPRDRSFNESYFLHGAGFKYALIYVAITALACLGYGAIFLLIGLFFRNPIFPALVAYGWEWINFLLPPLLKKISVVHYLNSLAPVPIADTRVFAVLAEPTPAWISVPGLLLVTILALFIASRRIRRMEIRYGSD
jgi:ABC-type transport system involved in multi-copper enzyme maturation permease subunit